jgi:hypothetical protein
MDFVGGCSRLFRLGHLCRPSSPMVSHSSYCDHSTSLFGLPYHQRTSYTVFNIKHIQAIYNLIFYYLLSREIVDECTKHKNHTQAHTSRSDDDRRSANSQPLELWPLTFDNQPSTLLHSLITCEMNSPEKFVPWGEMVYCHEYDPLVSP